MNLQLKGNYNIIKGKLKEKYGELTDDDLAIVEGEEEILLGKLQKRLGKSKQELVNEINKMVDA